MFTIDTQLVAHRVLSVILFSLFAVVDVCAAPLDDVNRDGIVSVLAYGDSITYGVGDDLESGIYVEEIPELGAARGYPKRLSSILGAEVANAGEPGERLTETGWARLPSVVVGSDFDAVIIMEGSNDAFHRITGSEYRRKLQRVINVARAEGKEVLLATLPPPVANNQPLSLYTNLYSAIVREVAIVNSIRYADVEQRFISDCPELQSCELYNIPEGLHPNTLGYDVIADEMQLVLQGDS